MGKSIFMLPKTIKEINKNKEHVTKLFYLTGMNNLGDRAAL